MQGRCSDWLEETVSERAGSINKTICIKDNASHCRSSDLEGAIREGSCTVTIIFARFASSSIALLLVSDISDIDMQVWSRNAVQVVIGRSIIVYAGQRSLNCDKGVNLKSGHVEVCRHLHWLQDKGQVGGSGGCSAILAINYCIKGACVQSYPYWFTSDSQQISAWSWLHWTHIWFCFFGFLAKVFISTIENAGEVVMGVAKEEQ